MPLPREPRRDKVSGFNIFVSDLFAEFRMQRAQGSEARVDAPDRQALFTHSYKQYQQLAPSERDHYDQRAAAHASQLRAQAAAAVTQASQAKELQEARAAETLRVEGRKNVLSSLHWTPAEWEDLAYQLEEPGMTVAEARQQVAALTKPPVAPTSAQLALLDSFQPPKLAKSEKPDWCRAVCQHRDFFRHTIFLKSLDAKDPAFMLLFAKQSPKEAVFMQLDWLEPSAPRLDPACDWQPPTRPSRAYTWSAPKFVAVHKDLLPDVHNTHVLRDVYLASSHVVGSFLPPEPLSLLLEELPAVQKAKDSTSQESKSKRIKLKDISDELLEEHPFLLDVVQVSKRAQPGEAGLPAPASALSAAPSSAPVQATSLTEEQLQQTWDALALRRQAWSHTLQDSTEHFTLTLRGGAWTQAHHGTEADAVAGQAARGAPADWCRTYGLPKMASFSIRRYGEQIATRLAEEWCARLQYFFDLYLEDNSAMLKYTEEALQSYEPGESWRVFKAGLQNALAVQRACEIEALKPTNP